MRTIPVYLDYGRTFFPDNVDRLMSLSGSRKTFRWAYKATELGSNVYRIGVCTEYTRDDCKGAILQTFARHDMDAEIVASVEGIR